ncbi:MAG TPA: hypothetical protein VG326_00920 [Tepidisphaeraceae bacterium]|jgi:hypothetical protein|nr:hypothetical protein [Tepidisphaeraceae bacterium]
MTIAWRGFVIAAAMSARRWPCIVLTILRTGFTAKFFVAAMSKALGLAILSAESFVTRGTKTL